jgi:endonuclease YncB( thermonuclease family)
VRIEGLFVRSPASLLFWLIVIVIVAAIAHVFRDADPAPRAATPAGEALAGRAKVVDGDSLQVAGERIRLFGIDAPEARQQCQSVAGRPYGCGRDATRALEAAIGGRSVSCTLLTHDRYNRDVAICTVGGRDLGETMVRAGHAIELPQHSGGRYAEAERAARDAKRGLWAGTFEHPSVWRAAHPR